MSLLLSLWLFFALAASGTQPATAEPHLKNIRQLTLSGDNGEAYFSSDGKRLVFQSKRDGAPFDQIYLMDRDGSNVQRISPGKGRATCSYLDPQQPQIIFSSTHHAAPQEPKPQQAGRSYEWSFDPDYDIFLTDLRGQILKQLTSERSYDAEATFSPSGNHIVFTSNREGDLEIYSMKRDGSEVVRLTNLPGYDGGAFYSPDETQIIFRGARGEDYRALQLFVMNADGSKVRRLTHFRGTSFAPYWHPSGKKVIFCSNHQDFRNFDLFLMDLATGAVEQVTSHPAFDGFPVFSPDGKYLVFASNRAAAAEGDTHLFIAEWVG